MFEDLNKIDWKNLGRHLKRDNSKIPDAIRNLISTDRETREKARDFLIAPDSDFEYVSDATSHIVPFILGLLENPNTPDRDILLADLSNILEHIWNPYKASVHHMRRHVETYNAFIDGMDTLRKLLDVTSPSVRTSVISVIKYLSSDVDGLLAEFFRHFYDEQVEDVQVALLMGIKTLLNPITWVHYDYKFYQELKEKYTSVFKEIIDSHPSRRVQLAAARASVEIFTRLEGNKEYASPKVPILLSEEFLVKSSSRDFAEAIEIMKDLVRLNTSALLNLLKKPTINAIQAHIIINGLLSNTMGLDYLGRYWDGEIHLNRQRADEGIFYVNNYSDALALRTIANYELNHPELNFERPITPVIAAIMENDIFWQTPTNMFSFFYDLPDSREEFREVFKHRSAL